MIIDEAELRRRYLLRIAGARDEKVYIGPEFISLNIADPCNLNCKYCWAHSPGNLHNSEESHFLPWEKFLKIVDDCVDLNVDEVQLAGAGEPTLHPSFPDMMSYLEEKLLKVKLLTNAAFPFEYCSDVIKGDCVVVNLSAVDRKQYHDLHGKDLFDNVVKNIKRLVDLRDAQKKEFHIRISFVVNSENIGQKQKMQEMGSQLGVNSIIFKKMNVHEHNQEIALPECVESESEEKRTPPTCLNGWFFMIVRLDGRTSTCCRVKEMPLGNFDHWSFKELWHSEPMMKMRLSGKYGHIQKEYDACQVCLDYDENIQRLHALARSRKRSSN